MPDRSRKRPTDLNKLAASIVDDATNDEPPADPDEGKDPAAVALGRKGGLKGGKARAAKLTPEQRSDRARKAVQAREAKKQEGAKLDERGYQRRKSNGVWYCLGLRLLTSDERTVRIMKAEALLDAQGRKGPKGSISYIGSKKKSLSSNAETGSLPSLPSLPQKEGEP